MKKGSIFLAWFVISFVGILILFNKTTFIDLCSQKFDIFKTLRSGETFETTQTIEEDNKLSTKNEIEESSSSKPCPKTRKLESNLDYDKEEVKNRPLHFNLDKALEKVNEVANLIYQRYEFHDETRFQFFIGSSNLPSDAWDLIKFKIAQRMMLFHPDAPEKNVNASYLMTFGGSSVTAGHDNYYRESYPFVVERRLNDIFEEIGIRLQVHNIAQGANNCRPADYCYEAQGGDNPDFIVWEQSFNCGRDKGIHELMARVAYWSGGIIYYSASGAFLTNGCAEAKDLPWTSEEWTPDKAGITTKYEITPDINKAYREKLNAWYYDGNAVSRFTFQVYGGLYKGVAPHGYSVWGHSSSLCNNGAGCDAINMKGECHENGGPHWMVAQTSYYANERGKHGKSWHPPSGMHLMRGEILAYNYAHILYDTIRMVQEDMKTMSKQEAFQKYKAAYDALRVPIPERALHLSAAEGLYRPLCYTNFRPHFNPKHLLDAIVLGNNGWKVNMIHGDYTAEANKYGYQDTRPSYQATGGGLEIHLRLDNIRSGEVRVCGYNVKEALQKVEFYIDPDYPFPANTPNSEVKYEPTSKRALVNGRFVGDECHLITDLPKGDGHVLTVRTSPDHPHHTSTLSHVIIF